MTRAVEEKRYEVRYKCESDADAMYWLHSRTDDQALAERTKDQVRTAYLVKDAWIVDHGPRRAAQQFHVEQPAVAPEPETYPAPEHGWTCFHCGEHFAATMEGQRRARDHFGFDPSSDPACRIKVGEERGLVMALRRAEQQLGRYRSEDSDKDRELAALQAMHAGDVRRAEEDGYSKGLRDGRALAFAEIVEGAGI